MWSRECPHYKRAFEIQQIKTELRKTLHNAIAIYKSRHPNNNKNTFAKIITTNVLNNLSSKPNVDAENIEIHSFQPNHNSTPVRTEQIQQQTSPILPNENEIQAIQMPTLHPIPEPIDNKIDDISEDLSLSFE